MKKLWKILLSLNNLRKVFGNGNFFAATKFNFQTEIIDQINIRRALVISTHPDDDCFGCAGAISKIVKNNGEVTAVYLCDGSGGTKKIGGYDKDLVQIRKEEAKTAGKILGVKKQVFFGYKDGQLASSTASVRALSDLIKLVKPDIIFVPSFWDNHPDHRQSNEILVNSLTKIDEGLEIWLYEIWSPVYANRILLINNEQDLKKESIRAHKSQIESRGYEKAILGLNQYRAEMNNKSGKAEAFFATTPAIYKELYRKS